MFERMGDPGSGLDGCDAAQLLDEAAAAREAVQHAECRVLAVAAQWADLHGVVDTVTGHGAVTLPGTERLIALGGEGTPEVAEFAPAELGAVLAMSPYAAGMLVADALDLRHRLPSIWADCRSGLMQPWMARKVAQATRHLTAEAAGQVDARVSRLAGRASWSRLSAIVDAAVIAADPATAEESVRAARDGQGVFVSPSTEDGSKTVFIRADASDVIWFDASIDRIADGLDALGDEDNKDVRRARAVGIIANPQQALELFDDTAQAAAGADCQDEVGEPAEAARSRRGHLSSRPPVTLYVHLSEEALTRGTGVARVEGVGPVTVMQVRDWLGHADVTVRPVIEPAGLQSVDSYEIPTRIREAVHLRTPGDVFPYASSTSRRMDLDHTSPYVPPDEGGPPGQTSVDNLAPLTRFHHRIRTHGKWTVRSPLPGVWLWRSPTGRHYLVDHTGTRPIPRQQPFPEPLPITPRVPAASDVPAHA